MYGHRHGYPSFGHFFGESSASDHPCRMGSVGWGGWGSGCRHRRYRGHCGGRTDEQTIPIDVSEAPDRIQILADVPGASKDSIQVEVDKGMLSIHVASPKPATHPQPSAPDHGQATNAGQPDVTPPPTMPPAPIGAFADQVLGGSGEETPSHRVLLQQRPKAFAKRVVELPDRANGFKAEASCTDGVLTITIPKDEVPETKKRVPVT